MRKTEKAVAESMRSLAYTASLKMTLDGMEVELMEQRSSRERIGPCPEREKPTLTFISYPSHRILSTQGQGGLGSGRLVVLEYARLSDDW